MAVAVKGYLFNLIIFTKEKSRAEYYRKRISGFVEQFPCRALFIDTEQRDEMLEVHELNSGDQLLIQSSPSKLLQTPYIVLRYLIPDLPVYLLWGASPVDENPLLAELEALSNRFIYDSECSDNLQDYAKKMLAKIEKMKIESIDRQWAAINGWRNVIFQCFSSQNSLEQIKKTSSITIKYNHREDEAQHPSSLQAIHLVCWLASQLDWKFRSIDSKRLVFETTDVHFQPQARANLEQGTIFEVEFFLPEGKKTLLSFAEKQSKVIVYHSTLEVCDLPFSYQIPDMKKGLNVVKEMFYSPPSEQYKNTLKVIAQIPWKKF